MRLRALLEFEDADGLRHTVFGYDKIIGAETFDALAHPYRRR